MHRRKLGYRECFIKEFREIKFIYQNFQISLGGLAPSEKVLRLIEDVCEEDDELLSTSFDHYTHCSGISNS
jgi:hypothetical protein